MHAQLSAATSERTQLEAAEKALAYERKRLEIEGKKEQEALTRALGKELDALIKDFESQLRDTVKAIDDKTVAQKIAKDSALRIARLKREFSCAVPVDCEHAYRWSGAGGGEAGAAAA